MFTAVRDEAFFFLLGFDTDMLLISHSFYVKTSHRFIQSKVLVIYCLTNIYNIFCVKYNLIYFVNVQVNNGVSDATVYSVYGR